MQLTLRSGLSGPLYRQVFETLRLSILDKTWDAGQALPPSRELAEQLAVSRNTVITAYDMLRAEGYVTARQGSGFFVAADLPDGLAAAASASAPGQRGDSEHRLSARGSVLARPTRPVPRLPNPAFQPGLPDLSLFPIRQWQSCLQHQSRKLGPALTAYQDQGGHRDFKQAVSNYLRVSRGLRCRPSQVIAVSGSQAGLDLLTRMLSDPGDRVAVEEPGYLGGKDAFLAAGAELQPVPVDEEGLSVEYLEQTVENLEGGAKTLGRKAPVRFVYTTPSYQFPLGRTMSAARRLQLLRWAERHNSFIVEDDYDSEFRYGSRPLSSLQGLDSQERVIYVGTFSKVMFPGLRLGYLVVPEGMAQDFASALRKTGQDPPLLLQAAMAEFIDRGFFASHLRRMRKVYGDKQALLVKLLRQHLDRWLEVEATAAGMQLACFYRRPVDQSALLALAAEQELNLATLSRYYLGRPIREGLYLGYAGIPSEAMEDNVLRLKRCFENLERSAG